MKIILSEGLDHMSLIPENNQDMFWLKEFFKKYKGKDDYIRLYARDEFTEVEEEFFPSLSISKHSHGWQRVFTKDIKKYDR